MYYFFNAKPWVIPTTQLCYDPWFSIKFTLAPGFRNSLIEFICDMGYVTIPDIFRLHTSQKLAFDPPNTNKTRLLRICVYFAIIVLEGKILVKI
jgi:hypothetical protein